MGIGIACAPDDDRLRNPDGRRADGSCRRGQARRLLRQTEESALLAARQSLALPVICGDLFGGRYDAGRPVDPSSGRSLVEPRRHEGISRSCVRWQAAVPSFKPAAESNIRV